MGNGESNPEIKSVLGRVVEKFRIFVGCSLWIIGFGANLPSAEFVNKSALESDYHEVSGTNI